MKLRNSSARELWRNEREYNATLQMSRIAVKLWDKIRKARARGEMDRMAERKLVALVSPGLYQHFKSMEEKPMLYVSDGLFIEVNNKALPFVSYTPLYSEDAGHSLGRVFINLKDGFWGPVNRPNDKKHPWVGKRFVLLRTLTHTQIGILKDRATQVAKGKTQTGILRAISKIID